MRFKVFKYFILLVALMIFPTVAAAGPPDIDVGLPEDELLYIEDTLNQLSEEMGISAESLALHLESVEKFAQGLYDLWSCRVFPRL